MGIILAALLGFCGAPMDRDADWNTGIKAISQISLPGVNFGSQISAEALDQARDFSKTIYSHVNKAKTEELECLLKTTDLVANNAHTDYARGLAAEAYEDEEIVTAQLNQWIDKYVVKQDDAVLLLDRLIDDATNKERPPRLPIMAKLAKLLDIMHDKGQTTTPTLKSAPSGLG